jgi:hypothetical protein
VPFGLITLSLASLLGVTLTGDSSSVPGAVEAISESVSQRIVIGPLSPKQGAGTTGGSLGQISHLFDYPPWLCTYENM